MNLYTLANTKPSYGELIDKLDAAQLEATTSKDKHPSTKAKVQIPINW